MCVKRRILASNPMLYSYSGREECAPAFIPSFLKYLWTVSFVPGTVLSARGKGKTCSPGA